MPAPSEKPTPNQFEAPLDILRDCHRRSEHFLRVLMLVARNASVDVLTREARIAVENALCHFRESAPKHHEDEEKSLLPLLRRSMPPDDFPTQEIDSLLQDHRNLDVLLQRIERLGELWLKNDLLSERDTITLMSVITRLMRLWDRHIRTEEEVIFPLAEAVLSAADQRTIAREMARGRLG
jgi:hemerythrin-like domain-containing protein